MRGEKVMIQCRWWPGFYAAATIPSPSHSGALQQQSFTITEKAPTRAFSWLKAPTSAFAFKTLLRHYAKQTSITGGYKTLY